MAKELCSGNVSDCVAGELLKQPIENGDGVRRGAVVIAEKNLGLIGERTHDCDLHAAGFQGQNAVVLKQHHRLTRRLQRERKM